MRILHVMPTMSARYGGPVRACLDMAKALAGRGHEVEIYTSNYDGFGHFEDVPLGLATGLEGIQTYYFGVRGARYFRFSPGFARAVAANVHRFDLVNIHSLYFFTTLVAGYYCARQGVPFVLRPHGSLDPYIYRRHRARKAAIEIVQDRILKRAAAIHYTTDDEMESSAPFGLGRPGLVLPLGLYLDDYRPLPPAGAFRRRHPQLQDRPMVLFFGRINFKKGLDLLAEAFGKIARQGIDAQLVIAGPDNEGYRARVEGWLREYGVLDRTTFTGMLEGREKLAVLRDADLFVLPSYSENFGVAVIEAMACGVPVVISDRVGVWRQVVASGAGRVCACDADDLAAVITEMLADPEQRRRCGQCGIEAVSSTFSWDQIGAELERAYEALIRGEQPSTREKPTGEPRLAVP